MSFPSDEPEVATTEWEQWALQRILALNEQLAASETGRKSLEEKCATMQRMLDSAEVWMRERQKMGVITRQVGDVARLKTQPTTLVTVEETIICKGGIEYSVMFWADYDRKVFRVTSDELVDDKLKHPYEAQPE